MSNPIFAGIEFGEMDRDKRTVKSAAAEIYIPAIFNKKMGWANMVMMNITL